jgi:hypothetical protein
MADGKTKNIVTISDTPHVHKVHYVGERLVVVIDDEIARSLGIDDCTWLNQVALNGDLLLRIMKHTGD